MAESKISKTVDNIMQKAVSAFNVYKKVPGSRRAEFLRMIADEIDALGDKLIAAVMRESSLPEGRLKGERLRTTNQIKMFADLIEEGSWVEARIDTALPERKPVPKVDLRKMLVPIGPVVVFGAANFPIAFSAAGGDTISALAAGCTVVVKAHPAHPETSALAAGAIIRAAEKAGMPDGVYQHLAVPAGGAGGAEGDRAANIEAGVALVQHPLTRAAGFTGSLAGGRALYDLACRRPEPIPFFAEMSSINPVVLLPQTLAQDAEVSAAALAASVTLSAGQFCTNPGLIIAVDDDALERFIIALSKEIEKTEPEAMLNRGIAANYHGRLEESLRQKGVVIECAASEGRHAADSLGRPVIASASARAYIENPLLGEEVFGPYSLIIKCADIEELYSVVSAVRGQLTFTLTGSSAELLLHKALLDIIIEKAGRLIINGVPTGVEVCPSMNHGGPYPASTDSRFTAVGTDAVKRFSRHAAFQGFPDELLPDELKKSNPVGIIRMINGEWKR